MQYIVRLFALLVALTLWSTLGVAVWLAIIVREVALLSVATLISLISDKPPFRDGKHLDRVAAMLPNGYRRIFTGLFSPPVTQIENKASDESGVEEFLLECAFAIAFYVVLAWVSDGILGTAISPVSRLFGLVGVPFIDIGVTSVFQGILFAAIVLIVLPFTIYGLYTQWTHRPSYGSRDPFSKFWGLLIIAGIGFAVSAGLVYWGWSGSDYYENDYAPAVEAEEEWAGEDMDH